MHSEATVFGLIGRIYDAAVEPQVWPVFLEQLADTFRAATTSLVLYDTGALNGNIAATVRIDADDEKKYNDYYATKDCWAIGGLQKNLFVPQTAIVGQQACPDDELVKGEFYNDFMRPMNVFHEICGTVTPSFYITALRPKPKGRFRRQDVDLLKTLLPHLERALRIHQRTVELETESKAGSDALDRLSTGFLLADSAGRVLTLNRSADAIVKQRDGLSITRNGLCASRTDETRKLRELIRGAALTGAGKGSHSGGAMVVSRPSLRRPFPVLVTPLPVRAFHLGPQPDAACVFITDPEGQIEPSEEVIKRILGLTSAEAKLVARLLQDNSLQEAAESLEISRNTAHVQLQSILGKTDTHRQSELIHLVIRSLGQVRFP